MDAHWGALFNEVYREKIEPSDLAAQHDTLEKQAAQVRPILVQLAEEGQPGDEELVTRERITITYSQLAGEIGSDAAYLS